MSGNTDLLLGVSAAPSDISAIAALARQVGILSPKVPAGGGSTSSTMVLSVRGTFYMVNMSDNSSPGMYAIKELTEFIRKQTAGPAEDPANEVTLPTSSNAVPPVLLTGMEFNQIDIISEVPCLNNVKVFYTFGQNFGQIRITGEVLLGPLGNTQQHNLGFKLLHDFFNQFRVSNYRLPISVSVANESFFVYLKGLGIGQIDPVYHILPFVMFGTLLDISRENQSLVNPQTVVITAVGLGTSSLINAIEASKPSDLVLPLPATTSKTTTATTASSAAITNEVALQPMAVIVQDLVAGKALDPLKTSYLDKQTAINNLNNVQNDQAGVNPALAEKNQEMVDSTVSDLKAEQAKIGDQIVNNYNSSLTASAEPSTATVPLANQTDPDKAVPTLGSNDSSASWQHPAPQKIEPPDSFKYDFGH